jgi:hypothetical protein
MFGLVVFLSAFLLFQLQMIVTKQLLPWFGGTPAVWTTSQMLFQVLLLAGYAYAHILTRCRSAWLQSRLHLGLLLAAAAAAVAPAVWSGAPLLAPASMRPAGTENPVGHLLIVLLGTVGLPFFMVATTSPLLQRWHSRQSDSLSRTYRLYALSNAGSFLGLVSYPFAAERALDLSQQAWLWAAVFGVFASGCAVISWRLALLHETAACAEWGRAGGTSSESGEPTDDRAGPVRMAVWILLAFTGSVMFLATTNQLCQDVAAVPLLWMLPLAVYLVTFIVCFDRPRWYSRAWLPPAAAITTVVVLPDAAGGLAVQLQTVLYAGFLFFFCMLCHGELVRLRPAARQITLFYLLVALGGALGGTFVSLGAPVLFPDFWEFHGGILIGWVVVGCIWALDRDSPFHVGGRWHLVAVATITLSFGIRYLVERTPVGRIEWVSAHGWAVTLAGGAVLATWLCGSMWRSRAAALSLWPRALVTMMILAAGTFLLQRVLESRDRVQYAARNFYGVVRVVSNFGHGAEALQLMHGTTVHGVQINAPGRRGEPTAYLLPVKWHRVGVDAPHAAIDQARSRVGRGLARWCHRVGHWHDVRVCPCERPLSLLRDQY